MLAWGDIEFHRLPHECVVYSQPVVSGVDLARQALPKEQVSELLAVERHDEVPLADIVFGIALDREA